MNSMFSTCRALTSIDISNFNMENVTTMSYMFASGSKLETIKFPENMNTSKVTEIREIFHNCQSLTNLDLNNWNTENIVDMTSAFLNCTALTNINVNHWDTRKVTEMQSIFRGCTKLTSIDLSGWETPNVDTFNAIFEGCTELKVVNCKEFSIKEGANVSAMFHECRNITDLNISKMDLSYAGSWRYTFLNVPNNVKITTNKNMKTWIETVYNPNEGTNFTNIETID